MRKLLKSKLSTQPSWRHQDSRWTNSRPRVRNRPELLEKNLSGSSSIMNKWLKKNLQKLSTREKNC